MDEALPQMRPEERFLDKEEIKKIIEIVEDNERYLIVVKMLCAMGLRQEELFALTVDDFTVDKNGEFVEVRICKAVVENEDNVYTIENRTKTYNSNRTVYLPCPIYKDLMKYYHSVVDAESMEDKLLRKANGSIETTYKNYYSLTNSDKEKIVDSISSTYDGIF